MKVLNVKEEVFHLGEKDPYQADNSTRATRFSCRTCSDDPSKKVATVERPPTEKLDYIFMTTNVLDIGQNPREIQNTKVSILL